MGLPALDTHAKPAKLPEAARTDRTRRMPRLSAWQEYTAIELPVYAADVDRSCFSQQIQFQAGGHQFDIDSTYYITSAISLHYLLSVGRPTPNYSS
jgi:hypothetical protein